MALNILVGAALAWTVSGQCAKAVPSGTALAPGFTARKIATVVNARSMTFDKEGRLLVVSAKARTKNNPGSIEALTLKYDGGCVSLAKTTRVVQQNTLSHGMALSVDGQTLYASSDNEVMSWPYDSKSAKAVGSHKVLINGMRNPMGGHPTRTLLASKKVPGTLLVTHGSDGNDDMQCKIKASGHCQIHAFDVTNVSRPYTYANEGPGNKAIAWGLRNSVGLAEAPDGGIWSNENGYDNMKRDAIDIHNNSPGEEVNFHGYLAKPSNLTGANFGYPECHAAWNVPAMPRNGKLSVGMHFSLNPSTNSHNDAWCAANSVPPKITLPSHWAPIDIKFNSKGTVAYMTSRGSWNRNVPDGYQLFAITFANGQPTHAPSSKRAVIPIFQNLKALTGTRRRANPLGDALPFLGIDNTVCPSDCFRPTGLAFDPKGNLYMASDATNAIYVIERTDGKSVDSVDAETLEKLPRRQAPTTPQRK